MNETGRNNTTLFLLYMTGLGDSDVYPMGMKMCYLGDNGFDNDYKQHLFLLFEKSEYFNHYLEFVLRKKDLYTTDYVVDDYDQMVVMRIPNTYLEDVKWFKKGKLSKMSLQYMKSSFTDVDLRFLAYSKNPAYKAALESEIGEMIPEGNELWSSSIPEQEIFRFNQEVFNKKGW